MTRLALLVSLLLPACIVGADDDDATCAGGKCDGVDQSCTDARYGDGTCDLALSCTAPDIDCFRTFASDAEGAAWYADLEVKAAAAEGRPSRAIVPQTDPRFAKFRALLDRGWEAMRTRKAVGKLGDARPALVFVEDPTVNAFVDPEDLDKKRAAFAVMIHTATLDLPTSDDATLGLIMHELQHAVGLHVVAGVPEQIQTFYAASPLSEPIGRSEHDDADVREAVGLWRSAAAEVGPYTNADLGGIPLGGGLQRLFKALFAAGVQTNPAACAAVRSLAGALVADLDGRTDQVSYAITTDASVAESVATVLGALRDECLPDYTKSFYELAADTFGLNAADVEASMSAEEKALVGGKHAVDAVAALTAHRRDQMRKVEELFATHTGTPWSRVRFFSEEEDADDNSVTVLRGAGLDPAGLATFFLDVLMAPKARDACQPALAGGQVPPYGIDLLDTHHGNCWRTYHVRAFADAKDRARAPQRTISVPAPRVLFPPAPRYSTY